MTQPPIGTLDHVAIAVHDADAALVHFRDVLGLPVVGDEIAEQPGVRLVYLDAGNTLIQLVQPVHSEAPVAHWLQENEPGLHHICFRVDDLAACAQRLAARGASAIFAAGRGAMAFFADEEPSNVKLEFTGMSDPIDLTATPTEGQEQ